MADENKRIIEIDGVKLEVDLRDARQIDHFRIGDKVKVLIPGYNEEINVYPGVIVGFENFKARPSITVAYLDVSYSTASVKTAYIYEGSKKEIVPADEMWVPVKKSVIVDAMDQEILKKKTELREIEQKKEYFLAQFGKYFSEVVEESDE